MTKYEVLDSSLAEFGSYVAVPEVFKKVSAGNIVYSDEVVKKTDSAGFSAEFLNSLDKKEKDYLSKIIDKLSDKTVLNFSDTDKKYIRALEVRKEYYDLASSPAFNNFPADKDLVKRLGNTAFDLTVNYTPAGNNNLELMTLYSINSVNLSAKIRGDKPEFSNNTLPHEEVRVSLPANIAYNDYVSLNEAARRIDFRAKLAAKKEAEAAKNGEEIRGAILLDDSNNFVATVPETRRPELSPDAVANVRELGKAISKLTNKDTAKNRDDAEGVADAIHHISKLTGKEQPSDINIDSKRFLVSGEAAKIVRIYNDFAHEVEQGKFVPAKAQKLQAALDNVANNLPVDAAKLSKTELKEIAENGGVFRLKGDYGSTKGVKPVDLVNTIDEAKKIEVAKN